MKRTWDKLIVKDKVRVKPLKSETVWLFSPILPAKTPQGKTVQTTVELLDCGKKTKQMLLGGVVQRRENGDEKEKAAHVQSVQKFLDHLVRERGCICARSLHSVSMSDTRNAWGARWVVETQNVLCSMKNSWANVCVRGTVAYACIYGVRPAVSASSVLRSM